MSALRRAGAEVKGLKPVALYWLQRTALALMVLALVLTASLSEAQRRRSGGSAGGSHFGGSHTSSPFSGGGSHSSGSGSSGSRSRGSRSGGSRSSGVGFGGVGSSRPSGVRSSGSHSYGVDVDPRYDANAWQNRPGGGLAALLLLTVAGLAVVVWFALLRPRPKPAGMPDWAKLDITQVRLVLSADARPFLQKKLLMLAESEDTSTVAGLHRLLGHTARALAMAESAWLYAAVENHQPTDADIAQTNYERLAQDARAQFTDEVIRSANGKVVLGPATGLRSDRSRDGEGVIVVTFVVAAKAVITDVSALETDRIRSLLAELIRMPSDSLVAFEVSWMPAEPEDRMSTLAVESLFPTLKKLPGVVGGHRICAYCQGPYTAELKECPHCGVPVARNG